MVRSTPPLAALRAIAITLPLLPILVNAVPQLSSHSVQLLSRQASPSCAVQCPGSLPADFCCPANSICQSLAANSTALCCPKGFDCSMIQPITCNLSLENHATDPTAVIMTQALNATLAICGLNCCPFGYTCNSMEQCVRQTDQSVWPPANATSAPYLGDIPGSDKAKSGIALAVGVIAGVAVSIALVAGGIVYWRHKKGGKLGRAAFQAATRGDPSISGPMGDGGPMRHDFINKRLNRVTSLFRRNSTGATEQVPSGFAQGGDEEYSDGEDADEKTGGRKQGASPYRPYNNGREPSNTESINVFADRNMQQQGPPSEFDPYDRRFTNATNFSDMMDEADLGPVHRGQEPYVPPVPQMPPQSAWNKLLGR